jgi:hypothetical protein
MDFYVPASENRFPSVHPMMQGLKTTSALTRPGKEMVKPKVGCCASSLPSPLKGSIKGKTGVLHRIVIGIKTL